KDWAFFVRWDENPWVRTLRSSLRRCVRAEWDATYPSGITKAQEIVPFLRFEDSNRRVGLGLIRRRFRVKFGPCGAEPIPAGSRRHKKLCLFCVLGIRTEGLS
ncbi:hypothetical protein, partial [Sphingobacterium deserti]|uniref:hypothetical protein n=1 Tax=Sphingobacterium deserti TaxID=1229276 RepID=UPI0019D351B6